jgi:hypothetical protein
MLLTNTFVHHVHFWLKNEADKQQLIDGLNTLLPIMHIRDIHIGVPADTHRDVVDRSYDVSLLILFDFSRITTPNRFAVKLLFRIV